MRTLHHKRSRHRERQQAAQRSGTTVGSRPEIDCGGSRDRFPYPPRSYSVDTSPGVCHRSLRNAPKDSTPDGRARAAPHSERPSGLRDRKARSNPGRKQHMRVLPGMSRCSPGQIQCTHICCARVGGRHVVPCPSGNQPGHHAARGSWHRRAGTARTGHQCTGPFPPARHSSDRPRRRRGKQCGRERCRKSTPRYWKAHDSPDGKRFGASHAPNE